MMQPGDVFNRDAMHTFQDGVGQVLLCMFPAFGIRVRINDKEDRTKVLVKAKVELVLG
jgi:hypothetical protein